MKTSEVLLIALTELREVVPALAQGQSLDIGDRFYGARFGICRNVTDYISQMCQWRHETVKVESALRELMQQWPGAYPELDYPVEGQHEYYIGSVTWMLWQNPRRIELLNWLIKTLTEEVENEQAADS